MRAHVSLVFYIGNSVIRGAVVLNEKNKLPTILASRVRELSYQEFVDRDHLEFRVMKEFGDLINDIKFIDLASPACKGFKPKDAFVILSSPWYVSETKIIKIDSSKPFTVTERIINDAIKSASSDFINRNKSGIGILEKNIIKYALNGYTTPVPVGKTAQRLEISVFFSFCKNQTIESLRQTILSQFNVHDIEVSSQSLAAFTAVRSTWSDIKNYVLVDISSQLTELMIVRQGILAEAASFPYGKQFIIQELAKRIGVSAEVSISILNMYNDKTIDITLKDKVQVALDEIRKDWLEPFTKVLSEISVGSSLPNKFILFSPKKMGELFSIFMKSEESQQFTFSEGKFEVHEAGVNDFSHLYMTKENTTTDVYIVVGTIFLHKKLEGVL